MGALLTGPCSRACSRCCSTAAASPTQRPAVADAVADDGGAALQWNQSYEAGYRDQHGARGGGSEIMHIGKAIKAHRV